MWLLHVVCLFLTVSWIGSSTLCHTHLPFYGIFTKGLKLGDNCIQKFHEGVHVHCKSSDIWSEI